VKLRTARLASCRAVPPPHPGSRCPNDPASDGPG
jgi:hypothetical protein